MEESKRLTQRYLDPGDRLGEVLFGLIMVLTITLTAELTLHDGGASVRELMVAAIGCNVAWGIIDGGMYVMAALLERARRAKTLRAVQQAPDEASGLAVVAGVLDDTLVGLQPEQTRSRLYADVREMALRVKPQPVRILREDLMGALACFLLVVLSLIPAIVPFFFIDEPRLALRWSNGLLVASLFGTGFAWGHHANANRWLTGSVFMAVGLALVGIAIALGG
jgi:VIT1/CCC1 family predicted Fe2+/Mn2+ transporter